MEFIKERSSSNLQGHFLRLDVFIVRAHLDEPNDQVEEVGAAIAR